MAALHGSLAQTGPLFKYILSQRLVWPTWGVLYGCMWPWWQARRYKDDLTYCTGLISLQTTSKTHSHLSYSLLSFISVYIYTIRSSRNSTMHAGSLWWPLHGRLPVLTATQINRSPAVCSSYTHANKCIYIKIHIRHLYIHICYWSGEHTKECIGQEGLYIIFEHTSSRWMLHMGKHIVCAWLLLIWIMWWYCHLLAIANT